MAAGLAGGARPGPASFRGGCAARTDISGEGTRVSDLADRPSLPGPERGELGRSLWKLTNPREEPAGPLRGGGGGLSVEAVEVEVAGARGQEFLDEFLDGALFEQVFGAVEKIEGSDLSRTQGRLESIGLDAGHGRRSLSVSRERCSGSPAAGFEERALEGQPAGRHRSRCRNPRWSGGQCH